jgi:NADH:ubiquinone oxidoreductase subunit 2 (subunit N)
VFFVVAFVANSILSLAYYVPALTGLLAKEDAGGAGGRTRVSPWLLAPLIVLAGFLLLLGIWPDLAMSLIDPAVRAILEAAGGGV